jgi:hypothetical protein
MVILMGAVIVVLICKELDQLRIKEYGLNIASGLAIVGFFLILGAVDVIRVII